MNFTVPANESFDSRTVTFQYQWGDEDYDRPTAHAGVGRLDVLGHCDTRRGYPGEGKIYSLTLTGTLPSAGRSPGPVRRHGLVTGKVSASGTAVSLAVPANASYSSRTVTFEYNWNGTWIDIESRTQSSDSLPTLDWSSCVNECSSKGGIISKNNLPSWTGWPDGWY